MHLKYSLLQAGLILSVISLSGCKNSTNETATEAPAPRVSVVVVENSNSSSSHNFSGTVSPSTSTTVSFSVPGTIAELNVESGQKVKKGQLLGRLKTGDYKNADDIAKAQLAEAQDAYARLKKLHDANALPDIKWVEMEQKLRQAENMAAISARALEETALYSPIDGVVTRKMADNGQNVAPIEPIFEIVTTDRLTVDISVPETEISDFFVGQDATVTFNIDNIGQLDGRVNEKAVVADPLTRTYKVKVAIDNAPAEVLPGMVATVAFAPAPVNGTDVSPTIILPSQAVLLANDNRTFVWVVKNGMAQRRFVEANELVANGVAIEKGLAPGDSVIIEGMQKVGSGTKVESIIK